MSNRSIRRSAAETRAHVLTVAQRLFYWQGIRATGVDQVAVEADVASTTLYRLFASKDDLVTAYVNANAEPYQAWLAESTREEIGSPRDRILALFDALALQTQPDRCRGCPFLMTIAEFPAPEHPARVRAVATKAWVRAHLRGLAAAFVADHPGGDPDVLADQLVLIMEGVYASVAALGADGPATAARSLATTLLDSISRAR